MKYRGQEIHVEVIAVAHGGGPGTVHRRRKYSTTVDDNALAGGTYKTLVAETEDGIFDLIDEFLGPPSPDSR